MRLLIAGELLAIVDAMLEPSTAQAFPMARCEACGESVLTYVTLDDNGAEVRCCVDCDARIGSEIRWVSAAEMEQGGYRIGEHRRNEKGCGTCANGCGISKS